MAVPLHDLGFPCLDQRYPALAGPWVVACGPDGRVDRALHLATGELLRLPLAMTSPGLGDGLLLGVGAEAGLVQLQPGGAMLLDRPRVRGQATAAPATDGERGALVALDHVAAWRLAEPERVQHAAHPAGWYPPALSGSLLAWVEDAGADGEDVWAIDLDQPRAGPAPLSGGPGHQRHVVASGPWLAWVEPGAVVVLDRRDGTRVHHAADTGFSAPPALWRDVVCWEERPGEAVGEEDGVEPSGAAPDSQGPGGVDIRCSDGLDAAGPGHQRWPSRHGPWLVYREGDQVWLRTAADEGAGGPG